MKKYQILLLVFFINGAVFSQTPCSSPTIFGKLIYNNLQNTALNASVVYLRTLTGSIVDSNTTDQDGNYRFCSVINGNYILTSRTNLPWGGVNSTDAVIALHHFVEAITLTGIKFQAGDVNSSSYINATDAYEIAKRFVHMSTSFPIGDWVFEEPLVIVTDTSSQNIDIKGLCTGDLDGSNIPFMQSFVSCGDTLTDQRDNQKYPTVLIGTQCWMKRNLNIGNMVTSTWIFPGIEHSECSNNGIIEKYCYNNDPANCTIYGGLYDWHEMMQYDTTPGIQGICPSGWHIPTKAEWCTLTTYLDTTVDCALYGYSGTNAAGQLKETGVGHWSPPNTGATNQSGFTALPGGQRSNTGAFGELTRAGNFWLSSNSSLGINLAVVVYKHADCGLGQYVYDTHGWPIRSTKN